MSVLSVDKKKSILLGFGYTQLDAMDYVYQKVEKGNYVLFNFDLFDRYRIQYFIGLENMLAKESKVTYDFEEALEISEKFLVGE